TAAAASRRRRSSGSWIRSTPPSRSARGPAWACGSPTASCGRTAARSPARASSGWGPPSRWCCRSSRRSGSGARAASRSGDQGGGEHRLEQAVGLLRPDPGGGGQVDVEPAGLGVAGEQHLAAVGGERQRPVVVPALVLAADRAQLAGGLAAGDQEPRGVGRPADRGADDQPAAGAVAVQPEAVQRLPLAVRVAADRAAAVRRDRQIAERRMRRHLLSLGRVGERGPPQGAVAGEYRGVAGGRGERGGGHLGAGQRRGAERGPEAERHRGAGAAGAQDAAAVGGQPAGAAGQVERRGGGAAGEVDPGGVVAEVDQHGAAVGRRGQPADQGRRDLEREQLLGPVRLGQRRAPQGAVIDVHHRAGRRVGAAAAVSRSGGEEDGEVGGGSGGADHSRSSTAAAELRSDVMKRPRPGTSSSSTGPKRGKWTSSARAPSRTGEASSSKAGLVSGLPSMKTSERNPRGATKPAPRRNTWSRWSPASRSCGRRTVSQSFLPIAAATSRSNRSRGNTSTSWPPTSAARSGGSPAPRGAAGSGAGSGFAAGAEAA